jgi:hypothetical protein
MNEFSPACANLDSIHANFNQKGFFVLGASTFIKWLNCPIEELDLLARTWNDLPQDNYLKDGGNYRYRRHSCFIFEGNSLTTVPHRAHWQSLDYNALHGGFERWFEPIEVTTVSKSTWEKILLRLALMVNELLCDATTKWFIEAHQFRIDTSNGIGRPTPEGAHRDGVDFVAVILVNRHNIKGGETRVFDANERYGERFTLEEPWSLLLLDDKRVVHETTPIQPLSTAGYRDTLVLTLRKDGFQHSNTYNK